MFSMDRDLTCDALLTHFSFVAAFAGTKKKFTQTFVTFEN
jgi:hypothetical protein